MKKSLLTFTLILTGILLLTPSCDDNARSLGDIYISIATVVPGEQDSYSLLLDDGTRLWPTAGNVKYPAKENQRVFMNYTLLGRTNLSSSLKEYDIKVNQIFNILTKEPIELTKENEDSIGNDPIKIIDLWVGGDFLNISFQFNYGGEKPHAINLVKNTTLSTEESTEVINLEFRHNAYESAQTRLHEGFVCFDLKSLRTDNANSVKLAIKVKEKNRNVIYDDVVYKYNQVTEEISKTPTPVAPSTEYY